MTSFYANPNTAKASPKDVLFIVYPDIVLLDLAGPLQVFSHASTTPQSRPAYRPQVASITGGQVETNTLLSIDTAPLSDWTRSDAPIHTLIIVGGDGAVPASHDAKLVDQVSMLAKRATRICSVCSGALVLAAAGLLDGRRAVTHWEDCDMLAARFPAVQVQIDPIFVKDGPVWTSAGITAGIDMALAVIEEDLGKPAAIAMARSLVTPMVRSGGQSQFSAELARQAKDTDSLFAPLHTWIYKNLRRAITVEDMAKVCAMSPRNFSRRYSAVMGIPPAKALEAIRVDLARDRLATTQASIKSVAVECGFLDDERMRRAFMRTVNTSPSQYRQQFQVV